MWRRFVIGDSIGILIRMQLEPHRIENREAAGEAKSKHPTEIPHSVVLLIHAVGLADMFHADAPAQHAINPTRIGEDDRHKDDGGEQHEE